jgi:hypothetical protein
VSIRTELPATLGVARGSCQRAPMLRTDLLAWQLQLYPEGHTTRLNLAIHLVTVPMFHMGLATLLLGLIGWSGFTMLAGWLVMMTCIVLQGVGHKREPVAPVPFSGPVDVVTRLLAEQLITYPRFVLGGGFVRAWIASGRAAP